MQQEIPSSKAQQLIASYQLGRPLETYQPRTIFTIIIGCIIIGFAIVFIGITSNFSGGFSTFGATGSIVGTIFPLFGLLIAIFGIWSIISALLDRYTCAIVCEYGVVSITSSSADAFRWEQVLKVFDRVSVQTSRIPNGNTSYTTRTTVSHTYTVHCYDGRKFVFNSTLGRVQDLAETIEVQAARYRH